MHYILFSSSFLADRERGLYFPVELLRLFYVQNLIKKIFVILPIVQIFKVLFHLNKTCCHIRLLTILIEEMHSLLTYHIRVSKVSVFLHLGIASLWNPYPLC